MKKQTILTAMMAIGACMTQVLRRDVYQSQPTGIDALTASSPLLPANGKCLIDNTVIIESDSNLYTIDGDTYSK